MKGYQIAGFSATRERVGNDYYATPLSAVEKLLDKLRIDDGLSILEPSAGEGHIVKILKECCPNSEIVANDLIKRDSRFGIEVNGGIDFLEYNPNRKFDVVITNPPFSLAQQFIEKAISLANRYVIMFAKIQLLEGLERRRLFERFPPKYVCVFSKRVNPLRNGEEFDENGKPWASTMCFAWFIWEIGYTGEPVIRWI